MNILKKILAGLAGVILVVSLVGAAWSYSFSRSLGNSDSVKSTLNDSGVYATFVDSLLAQADWGFSGGSADNGGSGEGGLALDDPQVREIADTAFNPEVLRHTSESFLDGLFNWLEGKSDQPDFNIDLTGARDRFLNGMAAYAKNRYSDLPVCANAAQLQGEFDPLNADCRAPAGVIDIDAEIERAINEVKSGDNFIGNPVITAETFENEDGEPVFRDSAGLAGGFQTARQLWIWQLLFAALAGLALVFLSPRRLSGTKRVGISLVSAGLLVLFGVLVNKTLLGVAESAIRDANDSGQVALIDNVALPLMNSLENSLSYGLIVFGTVYLVLGVAAIVAAIVWLRRQQGSLMPDAASDTSPVPPPESPVDRAGDSGEVQASEAKKDK